MPKRTETMDQTTLKSLLRYASRSGHFYWKVRPSNNVDLSVPAGTLDKKGYVIIRYQGKGYKAHRLAFLYMTGSWPPDLIDHEDGNKSNNRWKNLRVLDNQRNQENQSNQANSKNLLGLKGVSCRADGKYFARITVKGVVHALGCRDTPEEAHELYLKAKRKLHKAHRRKD